MKSNALRIGATIEARMSSTRLPGKVLLDVVGKPVLALMIERVARVPRLDEIVVATTENPADDDLVALAGRLGVKCHRGSEDDVMSRVLDAARAHDVDVIVELTGDCPLIDPDLIQQVIDAYLAGDADYVSNALERSYPIGMDTEVFATDLLSDASTRTDDPADREHVSLFFHRHPDLYRLRNLKAPPEWTDPHLRLTLDTAEDYGVISAIFNELYERNPAFGLDDVMRYLHSNPEIRAINRHVSHRWL